MEVIPADMATPGLVSCLKELLVGLGYSVRQLHHLQVSDSERSWNVVLKPMSTEVSLKYYNHTKVVGNLSEAVRFLPIPSWLTAYSVDGGEETICTRVCMASEYDGLVREMLQEWSDK